MREHFELRLREAQSRLSEFIADPATVLAMAEIAERILAAFRSGGKALAAGNGGSMADAMHFAEEFSGRFLADRPPYPAIALSDPAHMSCVANDYGFEYVFSRQVEALGRPGDVLVLLSTSGNSPNLLRAAEAARSRGVAVLSLLGRGGGELRERSDVVLMAPGETSDRIQELHMMALHMIIEVVEREMEKIVG